MATADPKPAPTLREIVAGLNDVGNSESSLEELLVLLHHDATYLEALKSRLTAKQTNSSAVKTCLEANGATDGAALYGESHPGCTCHACMHGRVRKKAVVRGNMYASVVRRASACACSSSH